MQFFRIEGLKDIKQLAVIFILICLNVLLILMMTGVNCLSEIFPELG